MKTHQLIAAAGLLAAVSACSTAPTPKPAAADSNQAAAATMAPTPTARTTATTAAPTEPATPPVTAGVRNCDASQFVACHTGEVCARRQGAFVRAVSCYGEIDRHLVHQTEFP